ncbi:MAG: GcrA family cell cycle regulator, partial [Bradyrhizobium sp.]
PKQPPDARRLRKKRARRLAESISKPSTLERAVALQLRCVAITPRHLALVDLEVDDCRYPYGGDAEGEPITFCGHPRHEGSSYCLSHFHLTSLPEVVRERVAAKTPLRLVEAA